MPHLPSFYYHYPSSINRKMNRTSKAGLSRFGNQENVNPVPSSLPTKQPPSKQPEIFVFDDEQQINEVEGSELESPPQSQKQESPYPPLKDYQQSMSQKEFEDRCSKIEDRIIFSNLKNFKKDIIQPHTTFFQDAKVKRRESQQLRKKKPGQNERFSLFSEVPKDVKVDFVANLHKPMKKPPALLRSQDMESCISDEITPPKDGDCDIQGACFADSKRQLKIEQIKQKNMLKVSNFREFLYTQLQPNYQIFLMVKRTENGLINSTYKFYFQENRKFVMSCEKQGFSKYVFSSSEVHISEDHISYLGKTQTNFMGSEFLSYDSGEDCSKTKMMEHYKKQMGYINYTQEKNEPRKFESLITTCDNKSTEFTVIDKKSENVLKDRWLKGGENIARLYSKEPSYDPEDCNFKLDFRGLAGIPSVKNFIVENEQYPDALIFGRQDKDTYLMRVKAPYSLLQAAAVCMSSIHFKFF